jgi:hypothetical protein
MRKLMLLASTLLVGASGSVYAPIGCGCADHNEIVAASLGVGNPNDLQFPDVVLKAVKRTFTGRRVSSADLDEYFCSFRPEGPVICRYWLWKKNDSIKALDLVIWTDKAGKYVDSKVSYSELPTRRSGT